MLNQFLNDYSLLSLHRYFIWANRLRTHFDAELKKRHQSSDEVTTEEFMYMSLWYASLYVVCEGWKELCLSDPIIDDLLKSENLNLLRLYRNASYHFKKNYYDKKFMSFITEGQNTVKWVRTLNHEFGRFFLEWAKLKKKYLIFNFLIRNLLLL